MPDPKPDENDFITSTVKPFTQGVLNNLSDRGEALVKGAPAAAALPLAIPTAPAVFVATAIAHPDGVKGAAKIFGDAIAGVVKGPPELVKKTGEAIGTLVFAAANPTEVDPQAVGEAAVDALLGLVDIGTMVAPGKTGAKAPEAAGAGPKATTPKTPKPPAKAPDATAAAPKTASAQTPKSAAKPSDAAVAKAAGKQPKSAAPATTPQESTPTPESTPKPDSTPTPDSTPKTPEQKPKPSTPYREPGEWKAPPGYEGFPPPEGWPPGKQWPPPSAPTNAPEPAGVPKPAPSPSAKPSVKPTDAAAKSAAKPSDAAAAKSAAKPQDTAAAKSAAKPSDAAAKSAGKGQGAASPPAGATPPKPPAPRFTRGETKPSPKTLTAIPKDSVSIRDAAVLSERGVSRRSAYPADPLHHLFPQEGTLAAWFKSKGINIHDYASKMSQGEHSATHTGGRHPKNIKKPHGWNNAWRDYVNDPKNQKATPADIFKQLDKMRKDFKIDHHPIVPYKTGASRKPTPGTSPSVAKGTAAPKKGALTATAAGKASMANTAKSAGKAVKAAGKDSAPSNAAGKGPKKAGSNAAGASAASAAGKTAAAKGAAKKLPPPLPPPPPPPPPPVKPKGST